MKAVARGNDFADSFAKDGAALDGFEEYRAQAVDAIAQKVKGMLRFVSSLTASVRAGGGWRDAVPWQPSVKKRVLKRREQPLLQRPHVLQARGASLVCSRCHRVASTPSGKRRLHRSECAGHVATARLVPLPAAAPQACVRVRGHRLAVAGPWVWCS